MIKIDDIVLVKWVDSGVIHGWKELGEIRMAEIHSVGILVGQDRKNIVISSSKNECGMYNYQLVIPRCCITYLKTLNPPKTWKPLPHAN